MREDLPTLIEQSLNSTKSLPSGLTPSCKNRSRYDLGYRRWNVAALIASGLEPEAAIPQATGYTKGCKSKPSRDRVYRVEGRFGNFRSPSRSHLQ